MPDRVVVRGACADDRTFVTELVWDLLEFGSPAWADAATLAPGFARALADTVSRQDDRSTVLIAQQTDGPRLGFISLTVRRDITGAERAHVADLAVAAHARRLRIGSMLMKAAESWAAERGLGWLTLDVWATNERALAFYQRLGFVPEQLSLIRPLTPALAESDGRGGADDPPGSRTARQATDEH